MENFLKFFRTSSLILALGMFLYVYAWMPSGVTVSIDAVGNAATIVTRDTFFFGGLVFLASINGIFFMFINLLQNMSSDPMVRGLTYRNYFFKKQMSDWFLALNGILNLGFAISVAFLGSYNNSQFGNSTLINSTIFVFPIVLLATMVWLMVILSKNRR
ncbi:hypothetical protein [Persicobacter psychrovividus]|uniref:Uncharacterized protein n=1 Tax=Persicobacter psychrovividus TaxID=387638 RepID=A0ABM7VCP6_9BACT|nr:hypothetical protein PEPS_09960 [Persicobacter psychrovividus]